MIHPNMLTTSLPDHLPLQEAVYGKLFFPILKALWFRKQWEEVPVGAVKDILEGEGYKMSNSEKSDYQMREMKAIMNRVMQMQVLLMKDKQPEKLSMLKRIRGRK